MRFKIFGILICFIILLSAAVSHSQPPRGGGQGGPPRGEIIQPDEISKTLNDVKQNPTTRETFDKRIKVIETWIMLSAMSGKGEEIRQVAPPGVIQNIKRLKTDGKEGEAFKFLDDLFLKMEEIGLPQAPAGAPAKRKTSGDSGTVPSKGKCGDGICDEFEKNNPGLCPQDCNAQKMKEQTITPQTSWQSIKPITANIIVDYSSEFGWFSPYVFGILGSPFFDQKGYELSKEAGFKMIAISAPPMSQNPNDPTQYDFSKMDKAVKAAIDNDIEPLIMFFTGDRKPSDLNAYGIYAQNVAKHLTQGWNNGYNYDIKTFRFGNEPDNKQFWTDTQENWFTTYVAWAKALKSVNKNFILDAPGIMAGRVGSVESSNPVFSASFDNSDKISDWITNFLAYVKKNNAYVDLVSIHAYTPFPYFGFYDNYRLLNEELKKYSNLSNIYGTPRPANDEWNLILGDFWSGFYSRQFDTGWAAAIRVNSLINMIEQGLWLSMPMFGTFNDSNETKGGNNCHDFPIVDCNGQGKPSYYAFKGFNQLAGSIRISSSGTDHANLAAIAGKKNNTVIIVLSNYDIKTYLEIYEKENLGDKQIQLDAIPSWKEYNSYVKQFGQPKLYDKYNLTLKNLPWSSSQQVVYEHYLVDDKNKLSLVEIKKLQGDKTLSFAGDLSSPSVQIIKVYSK